jgi:hypothetical protein
MRQLTMPDMKQFLAIKCILLLKHPLPPTIHHI